MGSALCTLFRNKPVRVFYFGLDAAGKTTLMYHLKLGQIVTTIPTIGFNVETINYNGVEMTTWDGGSRGKMRPLLRHYTKDTDAVVFVVDSMDHERLDEAAEEFFSFIVPEIQERPQVPVVVLANKQDLPDAMSPQRVKDAIIKQGKLLHNDWEVFPTSAHTLDGVDSAMEWLTSKLAATLARESWFPSSSVSETLIRYPASLLKSSFFRVSNLFSSGEKSLNVKNETSQ